MERAWQYVREHDEELAALAKALAHRARVKILRLLMERGEDACICGDICAQLPLAQSTISQHLKMLRESGLIRARCDGPRVCYYVDNERLARLRQLLADLLSPTDEGLEGALG